MSMISAQIDELRRMADGQATYRDARAAMLQAADTIWELRDDLQRANAENAKLRELAHLVAEYTSADQCEGCVTKRVCNAGELDMCWIRKAILEKLRELGVEVDG